MKVLGLRKLNSPMLVQKKYGWGDVIGAGIAVVLYIALVRAFIDAI